MCKQTVIHPDDGILFNPKKIWAIKSWQIWMNLKCLLLSERSQSQKATYYRVSTIWHSGKGKIM